MVLALLLAALPGLFWSGAPDSAPVLQKAGIAEIAVAAPDAAAWSSTGIKAVPVDVAKAVKVDAPGVDYKPGSGGATAAPWINSNLWQYLRKPDAVYVTAELDKRAIAVAMGEAYAAGAKVWLRVKPEDIEVFAKTLKFFESVNAGDVHKARANFAVVDDGTDDAGEVMNLMARRNLLFQPVKAAKPGYDMTVEIGKAPFTKDVASDPYLVAGIARSKLGDDHRLVRIYGSDTTLVRLTGDAKHTRVHLIHYGRRRVEGVRVRVLGTFKNVAIATPGGIAKTVDDRAIERGGTEFSVPALENYAVIDLIN